MYAVDTKEGKVVLHLLGPPQILTQAMISLRRKKQKERTEKGRERKRRGLGRRKF